MERSRKPVWIAMGCVLFARSHASSSTHCVPTPARLAAAGIIVGLLGVAAAIVVPIVLTRIGGPVTGPGSDRRPRASSSTGLAPAVLTEEESRRAIARETKSRRSIALAESAPAFIELSAEAAVDSESSLARRRLSPPEPVGTRQVTSVVEQTARTVLLGEPGSGKF